MKNNMRTHIEKAEDLKRKHNELIDAAIKGCIEILDEERLHVDLTDNEFADTDYDVVIYDGHNHCQLLGACIPSKGSGDITLNLYCPVESKEYAVSLFDTDLDPITLYNELSNATEYREYIDSHVGLNVYQVEVVNGQRQVHVDGYIFNDEGVYNLVQASGCCVPVCDIEGLPEEEVDNIIEGTFGQSTQYQEDDLAEKEVFDYYKFLRHLPIYKVTQDTPCGMYIDAN